MSRAAVSKSRADKGSKPGPASQTPVVSHEIVPGKFNDHDWNLMLEKDGSEDFVEDIVDELINNTLNKCFELYVDRQLLSFTISQAKDAILSIIEWQFLTRDQGEEHPESDAGWIQDEEPDPAVTDCWAQGSVPRTYVPAPTPEPAIEEEPEKEEQAVAETMEQQQQQQQKAKLDEEPELEDQVSDDEDKEREEATKQAQLEEAEQKIAQEEEKRKKKQFKPYKGRMKSPGVNMTESLEQTELSLLTREIEASMPPPERPTGLVTMPASCHSILKVQAGRPPGNKDVVYDDLGNVVAVVKINPETLPSHRVKVNYQVVDPAVEAAQARLQAMRTGRYQAPAPRLRKKLISSTKKEPVEEEPDTTSGLSVTRKAPLPPPLIESMEVAPGVTVREGGRMKQGPARYIRRVDMLSQGQKGLKPVAVQMNTPRLDVSDILDRQTPILRPMPDSAPLPPIIPHPPAQPKVST